MDNGYIPQVCILEIRHQIVAGAALIGFVNTQAVETHDVWVVNAAQE